MQTLYDVKVVSCWCRIVKEMTYAILYAFCLHFVCTFAGGLKAPGWGGGSGQSHAAAPGRAWNVAGIGLHEVTLSLAGQGRFAVVSTG
jgi:hypothetical protein